MAQWTKASGHANLQPHFNLWDPYKGREKEPTPSSCPLTPRVT